jgi:hypothetical protein
MGGELLRYSQQQQQRQQQQMLQPAAAAAADDDAAASAAAQLQQQQPVVLFTAGSSVSQSKSDDSPLTPRPQVPFAMAASALSPSPNFSSPLLVDYLDSSSSSSALKQPMVGGGGGTAAAAAVSEVDINRISINGHASTSASAGAAGVVLVQPKQTHVSQH